ncbi:chromosomal replication initiator protein DnaA isoform X2 [Sparus aurata]|uniref:chromosomal replication initiator protein DnaA isoform X2 n=1 Tax=Sparus aurata TaxID=8175 RepID=UPI0011C1906C|nr:chromosomal replication initiator protein DnaA-like isoform X2 [Sparus aurata]
MMMMKGNLLWLIAGIIFVSVVIVLIFLLINRCLFRAGKHRISQLHRRSDFRATNNQYQERKLADDTPPLPPRTQFLTAEAQSYENLAEVPDSEESTPDYEQVKDDFRQDVGDYEQATPDYEQATPDYEQDVGDYEQATPDYEQDVGDYEQATPDYEQATPDYEQATPDYEQDVADYVKVEEEEKIVPPPPLYQDPDPAADNTSEDYDDIDELGDEDEGQDEDEDYDDVG